MDLRPTPESWRVALATAAGSVTVAVVAVLAAIGTGRVPLLWAVMTLAALATLVPALGTLTASVDAGSTGVVLHRLGRTRRFGWDEIAGIRVEERPARVPDGTEYHWWLPGRHAVAVPVLDLADGTSYELSALASPAEPASDRRAADGFAAALQSAWQSARAPRVAAVAATA